APRDPWSPGAGYHPTTPQGAGGYPGYPQRPVPGGCTARPSRSRRSVPREPCPPPVRRRRPPSPAGGPDGSRGGAVALALVSGVSVASWIARLVDNGSSAPVSNALDAPKPSTSPRVNAPAGSVEAVAAKVVPSVCRSGRGTRGEVEAPV
ncbi:peptidase S1, partial [Rhodococcus hoagii]|nr:peptidase S1 [Prescottella equi]